MPMRALFQGANTERTMGRDHKNTIFVNPVFFAFIGKNDGVLFHKADFQNCPILRGFSVNAIALRLQRVAIVVSRQTVGKGNTIKGENFELRIQIHKQTPLIKVYQIFAKGEMHNSMVYGFFKDWN